jgi:2-dehydro-3-deoxygluconokinase
MIVMNKKIVLFGEYLLRLTAPAHQKLVQASILEMHWVGSEANIAVSLSIFGHQALFVTALPATEISRAGLAQLYRYNVHTHIINHPNHRVGTYYYESGQGARPGRVIYDRNHSAFSYLQPGEINWDELFTDADWFHWSGITPALNLTMAEVCKEALQAAKKKGLTISADFNYRNTLWQYGTHCSKIMPELLGYCDVVLADIDSAKLYFGINADKENPVENTCRLLQDVLPGARFIAMTMREQESADNNIYTGYLWNEGILYTSKSYSINNIVERIGSGDAFMAGLLDALRNKQTLQQVIEFATACSVMKHSMIGDFNVATKEEIETIIHQSGNGRIIR